MATSVVPQEDVRSHFYNFLSKYLSPRLDVQAFAKFMQEYMNDDESVRFQPRMTSMNYCQHLFKFQLIHPQNLDCIFNYTIYTRDDEMQRVISCYYSDVGGRVELLIPVRFNPPPQNDTRSIKS